MSADRDEELAPRWPTIKFEAVLAFFEADEVDSMDDCPGFAACVRTIIGQRNEAQYALAARTRELESLRKAFDRACKIIDAKDALLTAYRIGTSRAPAGALDYLDKAMPKHNDFRSALSAAKAKDAGR